MSSQLNFIDQAEQRVVQAQRELARDVERRRDSFAVQDFAKRRAAALKHTRPALNQGER